MALINPFGKMGLEETLQKIAYFLQQMSNNISRMYPDTSGRMRVNVEVATLPTVTYLPTLGNQTMQSGFQTSYDQYAQLQMCASAIRSQIKVSP